MSEYMKIANVWKTPEELSLYDKENNLKTAYDFKGQVDFSSVPLQQILSMHSVLRARDYILPKCALIGLPSMGKTLFAKILSAAFEHVQKDLLIWDTDFEIEFNILEAYRELRAFVDDSFRESGQAWKDFYKTFSETDYWASRHAVSAKSVARYNAVMNAGQASWLCLDGKFGADETKIAFLKEFDIPIVYVEIQDTWDGAKNKYSNQLTEADRREREKVYDLNSDLKVVRVENKPVETLDLICNAVDQFNQQRS